MRIENLRAIHGHPANLARFDVEVTPEILLCDMSLRVSRTGHHYVLAARHAGSKTAHLAPPLAKQITEAVLARLGGYN